MHCKIYYENNIFSYMFVRESQLKKKSVKNICVLHSGQNKLCICIRSRKTICLFFDLRGQISEAFGLHLFGHSERFAIKFPNKIYGSLYTRLNRFYCQYIKL